MGQEVLDEIGPVNDDPQEQYRIKLALTRKLLGFYPEAADDARAEEFERGFAPLLRQFERKLSRRLTETEHADLVRRLGALGPKRLGDVVLDLAPEALAVWLADPLAQ